MAQWSKCYNCKNVTDKCRIALCMKDNDDCDNYVKRKKRYMNRYTMFIRWNFNNEFDDWYFIIITNERKEYVKELLVTYQKEFNFESPVELMDYICDTFDMQWEDLSYDIEFDIREL